MVSKQTIAVLLKEIQQALKDADGAYSPMVASLKGLDPFLNLKSQSQLHTEAGKKAMAPFRESFKNFQVHVRRMTAAYNDLSSDLQSALVGRGSQDVLLQELSRQGALLAQEINLRQNAEKIFGELIPVLDRIAVQEKATPAQQKKIEDLVFRLQLLG
ncbi:MAG: hypothetical protein U1F57_00560 [bacterium]